MSFIKTSDSLKISELYFNVLKIVNNSAKYIGGEINFSGPENWKIITFPHNQAGINPNDTAWIPIRVAPSSSAIGGISYIINASFKTKTHFISENTYVTIPSRPKWDFSLNENRLFFTELNPDNSFQIKLSNTGNTNELIKIDLKIGKLIAIENKNAQENSVYIELAAFKDTIINYFVTYKNNLSHAERIRFENNWKESAIIATASSGNIQKSTTIMARKLNSSYINKRNQISSPLNINHQVYNLMSNQKARSSTNIYGSVLFNRNKDIQYSAGVNNLYYGRGNNNDFDVNHQFQYSLKYNDNRNHILLGYNIHGGDLHPINGRGITGNYKMNSKSLISYALSQNISSRNIGEYFGFTTAIGRLTYSAGITHEKSNTGNYDATSLMLGTGISIFKYHAVLIQVLGSKASYYQTFRDTSVLGYSYKMTYRVQYKKMEFSINGMNSLGNYIQNSGMNQIYIDGKYLLNDKIRIVLYGNRQYYSISRFPYNFENPSNYNSNDYLRLVASISQGNMTFQLGPNYVGSMRQFHNVSTGHSSQYTTLQPGIWGSATIRLSGYKSISPNITVSNLRFNYNSNEIGAEDYSWNKNYYYSAGVNYYDNSWKISGYYSSGSTTDLYRSIQIDEKPVLSRSIQIRPVYEKFLFERTVKLSAYVNYAYYMPSGRENTSYNIKYDQYLRHGWTFYLSGFVYSNTRVDDEIGRISTKDLNLMVGITKSFEIQQPRLKYYDFNAVFFNDLDGNLMKSDNEPPVPNILVNIEKDRSSSVVKSNMVQMDMISNINGEIYFENLPKDQYKLVFTPLVNLQSLYFLNGSEQFYFNDQDRTLFIPLSESFKVKGRIILVRDPNSSEGKIDLEGIRITATGISGETYSSLTDKYGAFLINVPKADQFTVRVNNVFGEQFIIETDEMNIQFLNNKTINLDFIFMEKRREIKFNEENEFFKFKSIEEGPN